MSLSLHRHLPLRIANRTFSTTPCRSISLQIDRNDPEAVADIVPAYPYGPARFYKQSDKGLYGGRKLRYGNNVGPKFDTKTRRKFRPNITNKRLWSRALNRWVQVRVSTRVLRTVDKVGGLDEYLLGEKEARIRELGMSGWWLRWAIMQTPAVQKRFAAERKALKIDRLEAELGEHGDSLPGEPVAPAKAVTASQEILNEVYDGAAADLASEESLDGIGEVEEAVLDTDGAFRVESTPDLPPIKFRVGPSQHIVLTPNGWRRTRPSPSSVHNARVEWGEAELKKRNKHYLQDHIALFEKKFDEQRKAAQAQVESKQKISRKTRRWAKITEEQRKEIFLKARRTYERDWDAVIAKMQAARMSEREKHDQWRRKQRPELTAN